MENTETKIREVVQHLVAGVPITIMPAADGSVDLAPEEKVLYTEFFYCKTDLHSEKVTQE